MRELVEELFAGEDAYVVGGAVRDELLGRDVVDLDVALREPERAARRYADRSGGAPFPLSERHGAWRVALDDGRTVDFTPLPGTIEDDLGDARLHDQRDRGAGRRRRARRPVRAGPRTSPPGVLRAVSPSVFEDDPLRLLRAVAPRGRARLRDRAGGPEAPRGTPR